MKDRLRPGGSRSMRGMRVGFILAAIALPAAAGADDVLRLKPGLYEITSDFAGKSGKRRHCMTPEEVSRDIKDTMTRINKAMSKDCQLLSFKQESRTAFSGAWQCKAMTIGGKLTVESDTAYRMTVNLDQGGQKMTTTEAGRRIGNC